jgi:hypothetical protein
MNPKNLAQITQLTSFPSIFPKQVKKGDFSAGFGPKKQLPYQDTHRGRERSG